MEFHDQLTMAQGMGKIEGLVSSMAATVEAHTERDDEQFRDIVAKMDAHAKLHSTDLQHSLARERELSRWKWSTIFAVGGTILGGSAVAIVTAALRHWIA